MQIPRGSVKAVVVGVKRHDVHSLVRSTPLRRRSLCLFILLSSTLLLSFVSTAPAAAQSAPIFQKTWGGSGQDIAYGVSVDSSGNVYTTGQTSSFGLHRAGGSSLTLLKYNRTGALVWQKVWSGENGSDSGQGVVVDSGGNIYVAGVTINDVTGYDILLLKFSPSGSLIWERSWGGSSTEFGFGVALDASGNVYVTGSTASFGAGSDDVALLKFNPNGALLWQKTWGGSKSDTGQGVAVEASGNIYVTGSTSNFGAGFDDLFLLKFNSTGSLLWQKAWGGSNFNEGYHVAVDSSGNAYVVGSSWGSSFTDAVILKFNSAGNLVWQRTWRGNSANSRFAGALDASGDIFLAGTYSTGASSSRVVLLELSSSGSLISETTWGGNSPGYDEARAVSLDTSGNALVTGDVQQGPPYTLGFSANNTLGTPTLSLVNPNFTLGTPTFSLHTPTGTLQTPSGSQSYGGNYDQFVIKLHIPSTITFNITPLPGGSIIFNGTSYNDGMGGNYANGTVPISAHSSVGYVFGGWSVTGGISVANSSANSTMATITGPGSLTANFTSSSPSQLYVGGTLLGGLLTAVSLILVRRRQK